MNAPGAIRRATPATPVWAVVLAFNQFDYTRECLRALRALDPAPDHVLLVDSGSSDGTPARARAEFPEVEVLALGENRWFAGGVNAGFERALPAGPHRCFFSTTISSSSEGRWEFFVPRSKRTDRAVR